MKNERRFIRMITISLMSLVILLPATTSYGQKAAKKFTVSGVVVDAEETPISNAVILLDNQGTQSKSDHKGRYKIRVSPNNSTLSAISATQVSTIEDINGRTIINFKMPLVEVQTNTNGEVNYNEQEVNIGYGSINRKNSAHSVNSIKNENKVQYTTIYEMMAGRLPGVEVNGNSVRISGSSSFMLSTEPLYVVDGIVIDAIDHISPHEVRSIEVLKGPAASIYGSRGANGVIVISLYTSQDYLDDKEK